MLQKLLLIVCLLFALPSFAQYKICKEYYSSENDSFRKKTLSTATWYNEHQNIIRHVTFSVDAMGFDTTDYTYDNNLLVKKVRYWAVDPVSRPADTVLNYLKKHPEALGHPLHNIIKLRMCDTEMTRYYYDGRDLLIKKEKATFSNDNQTPEGKSYKTKLADINVTYTPPPRAWRDWRVTHYTYNKNNKLVEAKGDLFGEEYGTDAYSSSARIFFYNSNNEIVQDSIVSYNGNKFDGAVSNYTYFPGGYEIRKATFSWKPTSYTLVFKLNNEGKVLEEARYYMSSEIENIHDPEKSPSQKIIYEYDSTGLLVKKSTFYRNQTPSSIHSYIYE